MTTPFISPADLGFFMGQDLSSSQLAIMMTDAACDAIRDEIDQYINYATDDTVILDGNDRSLLILPQHPIVGTPAVTIDPGGITLDPNTDYRVVNFRGMLERIDGNMWAVGTSITVQYNHGWAVVEADVDQLNGIDRVPSSIRSIALDLAAAGMVAGRTGVGGVRSETLGRYRYDLNTTAVTGMILSNEQCDKLYRYRVEGVA